MIKHVIVVMASAALGAACGLPNLDALGGDDADVEIVNADASNTQGSDGFLGGEDDRDGDAGSGLGSAAVDGEDDGTDVDTELEAPTPTATSSGIIETASGAAITLASTDDRMSLSPSKPSGAWGYLTVDGAFSSATYDDASATPGSKFVAIDYQLLGAEHGNFFDDAFRLIAAGETYSPIGNINDIASAGSVNNSVVVFEVPTAAQVLQLEGGVVGGSADGFTALYDIGLSPADPSEVVEVALSDAEVEAIVGGIEANPATAMSIDPGQPTGGFATLTVDGGRATARIDGTSAGPDFKFLIIDIQLLGVEQDNLFDEAFRLEADGEWYGPLGSLNETLSTGEVFNGSLTFQVPRTTTDFVLEGGMPEQWSDGLRTTVAFSLWDPAEGVGEDTESTDTTVEVEAEATGISLVGDDNRMTIDPTTPRGWGSLTLDRAYTTAKIEQDGARPGFKFLLIEYQLLGAESDNFFDEAFRLEAANELYSPLNNINEIIDTGEVFNGTVIFEVPIGVTSARLEAGVVAGSTDGFTTNFEITFV